MQYFYNSDFSLIYTLQIISVLFKYYSPEYVTAVVLYVALWVYEGTTVAAAATGCTVEDTGYIENVVVAGLGVAGFMAVTCRVCWA